MCSGVGVPVEVRDSTLEDYEKLRAPVSDVNREYQLEQAERDMVQQLVCCGNALTVWLVVIGFRN